MKLENRRGVTDLYRAFDANGVLLYVGISLSACVRLSGHRRASGWYEDVRTLTIERHGTRSAALQAERAAIIKERPLWNSQHNEAVTGRRGGKNNARSRTFGPVDRVSMELLDEVFSSRALAGFSARDIADFILEWHGEYGMAKFCKQANTLQLGQPEELRSLYYNATFPQVDLRWELYVASIDEWLRQDIGRRWSKVVVWARDGYCAEHTWTLLRHPLRGRYWIAIDANGQKPASELQELHGVDALGLRELQLDAAREWIEIEEADLAERRRLEDA